jgi:lysophospholipase L1-like esterase
MAAGGPVKIMPLGDSITYGVGSTNYNSYRKPLYLSLTAAGYNFDFVGGQTAGDFADPNHEGHNGWHADGCPLPYPPFGDILDHVYEWLIANPADIILLHIGTNDITYGGQDANEVNDILNEIDRYEADSNEAVTVILALIINRKTHNADTTLFNIDVNNMAQSRIISGDDIIVVDMESALNYATDMGDNLHPNDAGYAKMANVWYDTFVKYFIPKKTLTSSSTTGGSVTTPGEGAYQYYHGTEVNLVATADLYYHFVEWTGTAVAAGKLAEPNLPVTTVTMDANYTVVANFAIDQRMLTCSSTVGGSVTSPGEGIFQYDNGTEVNLVASANPDSNFVGWTGTGVDAGKVAEDDNAITTITMDANYTVVANFASDRIWDDDGDPNELWSSGLNWSGDTVPAALDTATIDMNNVNCLIDSSVDAHCVTLTVGLNKGPSSVEMTGGTLTTSDNINIGRHSDANGIFIMSGGTVNIGASARLWIGYGGTSGNPAYGTLIMTGGVFNVAHKIELGKNATGVGRIAMYGGTLKTGDDFEIGKYGNAIITISGGEIIVIKPNLDFADLKLADGGGTATIQMDSGNIYCSKLVLNNGTPNIYLDGGVILCSEISMSSPDARIDITEGELIVESDEELPKIQGYVSAGKIVGYGDTGIVDVVYDGDVIHVTARIGDPNLAWSPSPKDYATVEWTPIGPTLSWKRGRYAQDINEHNVYFGTDEDDVTNATDPNTLPGRGNQDPCTFAFPSPPPVLGQTYYWRIDEVNDACAPYLWEGDVWEFTMDDHEVVEDFDSYADQNALEAVWSLAGSTDITIEENVVQSGKSMKYDYDTNSPPYYSEVFADTAGSNKLPVDTQDWTSAGIAALTLHFSGDGTNTVEPMYVTLEDINNKSATVYYGDGGEDPNDLKDPDWHEWNIVLSDFPSLNDVNLKSISKIYIGFGDEASPGSSGTVYFDNIQLYPTRCVASHAPVGDVDGDCSVNLVDVNLMGVDWLEMDYTGIGYDGMLRNFTSPGCWVAGKYNNGLQLDGVNDWVDLDDSDFSNFHNKTIAFWVKIQEYPTVYRYMFYFSNDAAENPYRIYFMTRAAGAVRVRFLDDYTADFTAGIGVWRHLAFVLEDTADGRCTGKFYGDGSQVGGSGGSMPGRPKHSGTAVGVNIGSFNNGKGDFVKAVIDDFRVYDRALTDTEISTLYSGGEPNANLLLHYDCNELSGDIAHNSSAYAFYHPLLSPAELYNGEAVGSRGVNFMDYAVLADSWLKEQSWP